MSAKLWRILRDDEGATAVEYGLISVAIAAIIVLVVLAIGQLTNSQYQTTCNQVANAGMPQAPGSPDCPAN